MGTSDTDKALIWFGVSHSINKENMEPRIFQHMTLQASHSSYQRRKRLKISTEMPQLNEIFISHISVI